MIDYQEINLEKLPRAFRPEYYWTIIPISKDQVDIRPTEDGSSMRCIDRRSGMTETGYDSLSVPKGPAWLGASDGIAAFFQGSCESRMGSTVRITRAMGFEPAEHGDYLKGDCGCVFAEALDAGMIPDLNLISLVERRVFRKKFGMHYTELHSAVKENEGFLINNIPSHTVMPEGGRFYTIDTWFAQMAGISLRRSLPVIARVGELMLPATHRNLFIVQ